MKGHDLAGFGDVHNQRGVPLEDAKEMVIARNWTSVSITPNGHCYFKKFNYELNPTHLHQSPHVATIWIYNPKGHTPNAKFTGIDTSNWVRVPGMDMAGQGDCHNCAITSVDQA